MKKKTKPSEPALASIEMAKLAHEVNKKVAAVETKFNVKIAFQGTYKIDPIKPKKCRFCGSGHELAPCAESLREHDDE